MAQVDSSPTPSHLGKWLTRLGPVIGLVLVFGLFVAIGPRGFSSARNLETIARQTAIVGTASLGMTVVIISGGIDLSVGAVVALGTVVIATLLSAGYSPIPSATAAILACSLCGLLNSLLITRLRVAPFIVTLGAMLAWRGVAKGLAHETMVQAPDTWLNGLLASLNSANHWMLLPLGVWIMIALALATSATLRITVIGRRVFAIGSNEKAASLCGIPVSRVKLAVYTLCSALCGVAGLMQFSRLTVGDPTCANGLELDAIAAVVIGGGSLSGGEGTILGSLIGALIMSVIRSGCSQMGLSNWIQDIVTGCIIIAAVALDRIRHARMLSSQ